jgi:hypothetical protein
MTKSAKWLRMTRIEQYWEREQVIELINDLGVHYAWNRPDVSESCYHAAIRMRHENDRLAQIVANEASA